ncbi:MAG: DUF3426 domain-containing protein [Gammaproteobacteria bacterium]|nr:MAG: DUF3426 domain-containing protein [Gammaproteobacteria bacterium]
MFTRCPQCARVFAVSAQQLRSAQGDVRCGNCATVFNAVEALTDEPPSPPDQVPAGAAAVPPPTAGDADDPLEFDAPEQTWSNFFIEAGPTAEDGDLPLEGDLETITANPDEWRAMLAEIDGSLPWRRTGDAAAGRRANGDKDEPRVAGDDAGNAAPAVADQDADDAPADDAVAMADDDAWAPAPSGWAPNGEAPRPAGRATDDLVETASPAGAAGAGECLPPGSAADGATIELDDLPPAWAAPPAAARSPARRAGWLLGCAALALLAAAQWLHLQRDALAADPRWGDWLRAVYAALDQPLYPAWPLSAYTLRRAEAIAGSSASDALDIHAVIEIGGSQPVGLPLVSVTLRDQWGNPVGRGIFRPAQYLRRALPPIVAPGTRIPVDLSLVDPGEEARGYVVDVCLPSRRAGLRCKLGVDPFAR